MENHTTKPAFFISKLALRRFLQIGRIVHQRRLGAVKTGGRLLSRK